jgi:hypothetical protein
MQTSNYYTYWWHGFKSISLTYLHLFYILHLMAKMLQEVLLFGFILSSAI